jgi:superfamily I DNA/RNA helicase
MAYKKYTPKPTVVRTPFKPSYPASPEQEVIFDQWKNGKDHVHIEASAGSGKSTTLVWSMSMEKNPSSAMLAFGADIVRDIEPRCAENVTVGTCHSFGRRNLAAKFGNNLFLQNDLVRNIICKEWPNLNPFDAPAKEKGAAFNKMNAFTGLVDKLRVNLTDETNEEEVMNIANQYNIDIDPDIVPLLPTVFDRLVENPKVIDFTSMLWLPIRMNLDIKKFDVVYADEVNDHNSLMIEFTKRMTGERIMSVGDSSQSIFGFSGADPEAIQRLRSAFPGVELDLSVCYRCSKKIVELAATIVDKIKPYDKNPDGTIEYRDKMDIDMPDGSMILSRKNANLIQPCFQLLKQGRKAIIKGKDIGAGLMSLISQLKASSIMDLQDKIEEYRNKRVEKLMSYKEIKVSSIEQVNDQADCILAIAENCSDIGEVSKKIEAIFAQDTQGITLSSIHRAKGKEAKMVTILDYSRIRLNHDRMSAADHIQERNLHYVGVSRAIETLHLIN